MPVGLIPKALFHLNLPGTRTRLPSWRVILWPSHPTPEAGFALQFLRGPLSSSVDHFIHGPPAPTFIDNLINKGTHSFPGLQPVCTVETCNHYILCPQMKREKLPLWGWALKSLHCVNKWKHQLGCFLSVYELLTLSSNTERENRPSVSVFSEEGVKS